MAQTLDSASPIGMPLGTEAEEMMKNGDGTGFVTIWRGRVQYRERRVAHHQVRLLTTWLVFGHVEELAGKGGGRDDFGRFVG